MADNRNWLQKATSNPEVQAWYQQLQSKHQDLANVPMEQFMTQAQSDPAGYRYDVATNANSFPVTDPRTNELHWNDIGKTPEYYMQNDLPENSMGMTQQFEGWEPEIYQDTKGNPTIGTGLNLNEKSVRRLLPIDVVSGKRPITREENDMATREIYKASVFNARKFSGDSWYSMSPEQRASIVDMNFNMGAPKLSKFKKMRKALQEGNWTRAADEMVNSKWYNQVGNRSKYHEGVFRKSANPRLKAIGSPR